MTNAGFEHTSSLPPEKAISGLDLKAKEPGIICGFSDDCFAQKYLSMGILPGSTVKLVRKAPVGEACYFKIDGKTLAVRKEEAACLLIHKIAEAL